MTEEKTIVVRRVPVGPGTVLSNTFRIESRIGTGRMAEVFRGHNIQTGDPVAIKVVLPAYSARAEILAQFRKEARLIQHLAHDAIARYYLFAVDEGTGRAFLAMDYVEGPSLGRRLESGPLSLAEWDVLRRRIADGLQKAHEAGIVHRDISPDNIVLPEGEVARAKVIDFDIALSFAGEDRRLVKRIARMLDKSAVRVFYDEYENGWQAHGGGSSTWTAGARG